MKMSEFEYYIQQLGGPNHDDTFHGLIEANVSVIPALIAAYRAESSSRKRAVLIEIIGYHRLSTVDFLAEALQDNEPEVWKAALDALVTLNHSNALQTLTNALVHFQKMRDQERVEWIDEAAQQIKDHLTQ
jgi:HEAT repeat protein